MYDKVLPYLTFKTTALFVPSDSAQHVPMLSKFRMDESHIAISVSRHTRHQHPHGQVACEWESVRMFRARQEERAGPSTCFWFNFSPTIIWDESRPLKSCCFSYISSLLTIMFNIIWNESSSWYCRDVSLSLCLFLFLFCNQHCMWLQTRGEVKEGQAGTIEDTARAAHESFLWRRTSIPSETPSEKHVNALWNVNKCHFDARKVVIVLLKCLLANMFYLLEELRLLKSKVKRFTVGREKKPNRPNKQVNERSGQVVF